MLQLIDTYDLNPQPQIYHSKDMPPPFFAEGGEACIYCKSVVKKNMKSTPYHHTLQHSPMRRWLEPLEPPLAQLTGHLDAELNTKGLRVPDN